MGSTLASAWIKVSIVYDVITWWRHHLIRRAAAGDRNDDLSKKIRIFANTQTDNQVINSKTEATLILCGYSGSGPTISQPKQVRSSWPFQENFLTYKKFSTKKPLKMFKKIFLSLNCLLKLKKYRNNCCYPKKFTSFWYLKTSNFVQPKNTSTFC